MHDITHRDDLAHCVDLFERADAQTHLFEPFYRAANMGSQSSGFGLGLHIVREIVQRHDGRIEITSTENVGSTFRVVLPLHAP